MTTRARAESALVGMAAIWGVSFVVVKEALADITPAFYLSIRFALGAILLAPGAARASRKGPVMHGIVLGLLLFAGCILQTLGIYYTSPSKAAFLTALYIVIVPLLSSAVARVRTQTSEWAGVACAAAGMMLLTIDPGTLRIEWGDWMSIACAWAFAFHILLLGRYSPHHSAQWLSFLQVAAGAAAGVLLTPLLESPAMRWTPRLAGAFAFSVLLTTALAYTVQTWAQARTTATRATLIFALEPVFAAAASYLLGGEHLSRRAIAGGALILAAIAVVELKPGGRAEHLSH